MIFSSCIKLHDQNYEVIQAFSKYTILKLKHQAIFTGGRCSWTLLAVDLLRVAHHNRVLLRPQSRAWSP